MDACGDHMASAEVGYDVVEGAISHKSMENIHF